MTHLKHSQKRSRAATAALLGTVLVPLGAIGCAADVAPVDAPQHSATSAAGPAPAPVSTSRAHLAAAIEAREAPPPVAGRMHPMDLGDDAKKLLKVSADDEAAFKTMGSIVSMVSGISGYIDAVTSIGQMLGIFDSSSTIEMALMDRLNQIEHELNEALSAIAGSDYHQTAIASDATLGRLKAAASVAHDWVVAHHTPYPAENYEISAGYGDMNYLTSDSPFERTAVESVNDGEWKSVVPDRPPVSHGMVGDHRVGMPALLTGIVYRMLFMAAVDPTFARDGRFDTELTDYRNNLIKRRNDIVSNLKCGWGLTYNQRVCAFNPIASYQSYKLDMVCADILTGEEVVDSVEAPIEDRWVWPPDPSATGCAVKDNGGVNSLFLDISWMGIPSVRDRFNSAVDSRPAFADLRANGYDDTMAALKRKLGLFEIQRTIDALETIITRDPGLVRSGSIVSGLGTCLGAQDDKPDPMRGVTSESCAPGAKSQSWTYDASTGAITNGSGYCLDVRNGSTRRGTLAWLYWCTGDDAQRWSFDPETRLVRNALGRTLDIYNGSSSPGTLTWTWDENRSVAQVWGYEPWWSGIGYAGF